MTLEDIFKKEKKNKKKKREKERKKEKGKENKFIWIVSLVPIDVGLEVNLRRVGYKKMRKIFI